MSTPLTVARTLLDVLLRAALTLVVVVLLWMGFRLIMLVHRMTAAPGYTTDHTAMPHPEVYRAEQIADQRSRFPLPLFPGARDPEFGEMEINGRPFFRCDYDVSARPEEVLNFYRHQLIAGGWRDLTEDAIRQAAIMQRPEQQGVLDFQNETFLRYYDHMMKTQASFSRSGAHVQVVVKAGALPWSTRVGITRVEYDSPEELARDLERALGAGGSDQPDTGPATFAQNLGDQRAETTILTSRLPPGDYRDDLLLHYRETGWTDLAPPSPVAANAPLTGSLIKGDQMVFLNVTFDPEHEVSRAVITTMGPR